MDDKSASYYAQMPFVRRTDGVCTRKDRQPFSRQMAFADVTKVNVASAKHPFVYAAL